MTNVPILRVARPTDHLTRVVEMYTTGLGLSVLAEFADHAGFDGCILGHVGAPYHIEFTSQRGVTVGIAPSKEHLIVFYIANRDEWSQRCHDMVAAGFVSVASHNPYWDVTGRTFEDVEGYRVVLQNGPWSL